MTPAPTRGDVALALALTAVSATIVAGLELSAARSALGVAMAAAHVLPVALRRRHPVGLVAWMSASGLVFVAAGFPAVGLGPAALVAVYTVAALRPRPVSVRAAAVATLAMVVAVVASGSRADTVVGNVAVFGAAWLVGDGSRRSWDRANELARTREELARRAVVDERLRIARELHDVVAHSLSVIAVQAGTGRVVLDDAPDVAASSLVAIEETSRRALQEMRRLLDVLRADDEALVLAPSPGLDAVDELAATAAAGGLAVDVRIEGVRRPLPAGADLAAYRILQEALTNVRRHAAARRVAVVVRYRDDAVELEVVDDGVGVAGGAGAGHGLVGIRERAALYGGEVEAGPRAGGGYAVRARIPDHRATDAHA